MIAIDSNKQQIIDVDPRAIQKINFAISLDTAANITMFFIIEQAKKNFLRLFTRICKVIVNVLQNSLIFIDIK